MLQLPVSISNEVGLQVRENIFALPDQSDAEDKSTEFYGVFKVVFAKFS